MRGRKASGLARRRAHKFLWIDCMNLRRRQKEPNLHSYYASLIRRCGDEKDLADGQRIHAQINATGHPDDTFLANLLVQMYGKCGSVQDAWIVFNNIRHRDLFSWNFMIAAYAHNGHEIDALRLYKHMQMESVNPDKFTFSLLLSVCARLRALTDGKLIHQHIVGFGNHSDISVMNSLVNMYGKCGSLEDACLVFAEMHKRDVISWNTMIAAYVQNGHGQKALELFKQMELEGVKPSRSTFLSTLAACVKLSSLENGRAIHERIVASGTDLDVSVRTALVNMYGKCGSLEDARAIFDEMPQRNVISWTAMIAAYAQNGCGKQALELFKKMDLEAVKPNKITFLSALDACTSLTSLEKGRAIHEQIVASGFESDVCVRNALVNMYGKCGALEDACALFDKMHERNEISWTAMIAAYAQNGCPKEAVQLFRQMDLEGMQPSRITFLTTLDACAGLASIETGRVIHERIIASGFDSDVPIRNALINMYSKCGNLEDARELFDNMAERNVISWTTMIAAYAQIGHGQEALELFRKMELEDVQPNRITFLSILNACSHVGDLHLGQRYFVSMSGEYGMTPSEKHHARMVGILGQAGYLDEAEDLIINIPVQSIAILWTILLHSCRIYGDVERAARVAEHVFQLDPDDDIPCISLSNIYAAVGKWDDVEKLRKISGRGGD